jgi:ADP-L-glycero-D-manno-heptose 6-epimerase
MKIYDDQLIIVTGGAGFIGSCVVKHLNDQGLSNILVVDDLGTDEKWRNLVGKRFLEIISPQDLFDWLPGKERWVEAILHLGACTDTTETDADYLLDVNYRFSIDLAEFAVKNNIRFIYASSAATYGDGKKGFSDDHDFLETFEPLNMYGFSKHLFDLWVKNQGLIKRFVGLKYFNVFGPNEGHKGRMASVITHFLPQIQKNGKVKLFKSNEPDKFADGGQQRDFIYVKDVVRMTCAFLNNDAAGIFNIGSGIASSWNQLTSAIFRALNLEPNIEYIPMPEDLHGKYQNYTCAEMDKTREALGDIAQTFPLDEAVAEYVQEYLLPQKVW